MQYHNSDYTLIYTHIYIYIHIYKYICILRDTHSDTRRYLLVWVDSNARRDSQILIFTHIDLYINIWSIWRWREQSTEYRVQRTETSASRGTCANSSLCSLNSLNSLNSLTSLISLNSLLARHPWKQDLSTTTHLPSLTLSQSHMSQGVGYVTSVTRCDKARRYLAPRCSLKIPTVLGKLTFFSYLCTIMRA